jgi:ribosomal protein S18
MNEWPTVPMGNLQAMMVMRQQSAPVSSINSFDPYQAMLRRKQSNTSDDNGYINAEVEQYDFKDIEALEEFCQQYGIIGFNFGKMNPKSALRMLKNKMGIVEKVNNKKMLLD